MKQPDLPTLDKPAVRDVKAESTGRQVVVSWEIPETASPAFAYKIEVFDNPASSGVPVTIAEERLPSARRAIVNAAAENATVRLTVTDVFDQPATPVTVAANRTALLPPRETTGNTMPGLSYTLYQSPKAEEGKAVWEKLDELQHGKVVRPGASSTLQVISTGLALRRCAER